MRRKSLSPERLTVVVERYRAGLGIREVAAELGLPKTTVQDALARSGTVVRPSGRRRRADVG
jgi:DNA-directed RNA polymerase specialized sigma24 family protein